MTAIAIDESIVNPDPLPPPDPLTPFAVLGGPTLDIPVADTHMTEAYSRFCRFYGNPDHEAIRRGAQKALAAIKQHDRWTVLPTGTLELKGGGSDTYLVSDEDCRKKGLVTRKGGPVYCPSFRFGQGKHGGQCYHIIARELLRIAQELACQEAEATERAERDRLALTSLRLPTDDLDTDLAFVTVAGDELAAVCLLVCRAGKAVRFSATNGDLHIRAGKRSVTLDGQDGMGVCALTVTAADFAALWETLCPVARDIPTIQVFVDLDTTTIHFCAVGDSMFSASAPGMPMEEQPCCTRSINYSPRLAHWGTSDRAWC